jgi:hypothetical protein
MKKMIFCVIPLIEEQGFQLSGEVDDDSAKSIGKLSGAGAIVTTS